MNTFIKVPFYAKVSLFLTGIYVFTCILIHTQDIILPIIYSVIIAISVSPAVKYLTVRKKINPTLAITIVLVVTLLVIVGIILLVLSQASLLSESWPQLMTKLQGLLRQSVTWAAGFFNISPGKINTWIANTQSDLYENSGSVIGTTITTMGGVLATAFLTPVYTFMLLLYQPHLLEFFHRLFGARNNNKVNEILHETKTIIQNYLTGLFIEFAIIAVLNSLGLFVLGIEYAVLLGVIGAFLNVIPYLGGIIGVVLFMVVALLTKAPIYLLYVAVLYSVIQLIDNNYIVPKIVGSKVKLNALISIIAVIAGAALWGIPGMFLSIPMLAVVKLILDRIESMKAWGFLLGDTLPPLIKLKPVFKKSVNKLTKDP